MKRAQLALPIDHTPSTLTARAAGLVKRSWNVYWERRAQQATIRILHSLDGRTLHDIGVNQSEIESTVYGRPGERMRSYDQAWRRRSAA